MDLIEIGASFDWISPLLSIGGDIIHGGGHHFAVPADCGWSGHDIANLLKGRGVNPWGVMVISDTILFTVKKEKARWAQYVLEGEGIMVCGGDVGAEPNKGKGNGDYQPGSGWSLFG